jgi:nucleoside 2-deoxyribosyltransferase
MESWSSEGLRNTRNCGGKNKRPAFHPDHIHGHDLDAGAEARFRLLCGEIRKCDGLFAVLDGRDPGTIWEMGYAFATGKPVIAFCENDPFFSLMIDGSAACLAGLESIDGRIAGYLRTDDVSSMPKYQVRDRCDY